MPFDGLAVPRRQVQDRSQHKQAEQADSAIRSSIILTLGASESANEDDGNR